MVNTHRTLVTALSAAVILSAAAAALADTKLVPPTGYRTWFHVNTSVVDKPSPLFADLGGMHNIYVNATGLKALKSGGTYADKSVFVDDVHEFSVDNGAYGEAGRKGVAIMVKDAKKYAATGGWGFQFWLGGDSAKPIVTDPAKQCFACHTQKKDHQFVFSTYIP
jgi:hypothetical protein